MDAAERQALRDWLAARGASPERIARAEAAGYLGGLASELVLTEGADLSAHDLAARVGVDVKDVVELFRHFGVAVADTEAPQFTEADARMCSAMIRPGEHDVKVGDLDRVVAAAMDRIAEAAVALYVQGPEAEVRRAGADAVLLAEKTATATTAALDLGTALGVIFRHHMRQAVARQRLITEGVSRRELARLAIGFVDLVGSTTMASGLDVGDLAAMVSRFEARAFEVISAGGGRLVKFIGDEIMVAAVDPLAGCRIISSLVDAFTADGLRPRAGLVYGEVLYRHGDYYGPVVNLAARLVGEAIPDEVLVDRSVVEAIGAGGPTPGGGRPADRPVFEPAGRRLLKGFDEPVAVWSLSLS
jgi:adenylate cyclase